MRILTVLYLITAAAMTAQTPADAPIQHIQAELTSAIKLSKVKVGDKLKAQTVAPVTLSNGIAIPAGSTLLGQVLKCDATSVSVSFDQASVEGHKIALNITLVGAAMMGPKSQITQGTANASMDSPSPDDHPLNGSRRSVTETGNNAVNGVSHETLSEVNAGTGTLTHRADVPAHAGAVIGMPGVKLVIDDAPPFASKFEITNKEMQVPHGVQLMFSVRPATTN